jgi:hypothetical protein
MMLEHKSVTIFDQNKNYLDSILGKVSYHENQITIIICTYYQINPYLKIFKTENPVFISIFTVGEEVICYADLKLYSCSSIKIIYFRNKPIYELELKLNEIIICQMVVIE